jgi:eukaryotic-like serine/threonine-protein kinase
MRLGSSLRRRRGHGRATRAAGSRPDSWFGRLVTRVRGIDRRVGWATLVSLAGLAFGYLTATRLLFPAPPPPGELYTVPDIRGMTLAEAQVAIVEAGLERGDLDRLKHPLVDSGRVVGQAPLPGQLAAPGRPVRLTISLGAERGRVPEVTRLRADRAVSVLRATGLIVRVDSVESWLPLGRVVAVLPAEGTEVTLPTEVRLTVSLGPPTVLMPVLLGLSERQARDTLAALGLTVSGVEEVFRFGRDQGRVVGQEPPPDRRLERGEAVRLLVGRRGRGGRGGGEQ